MYSRTLSAPPPFAIHLSTLHTRATTPLHYRSPSLVVQSDEAHPHVMLTSFCCLYPPWGPMSIDVATALPSLPPPNISGASPPKVKEQLWCTVPTSARTVPILPPTYRHTHILHISGRLLLAGPHTPSLTLYTLSGATSAFGSQSTRSAQNQICTALSTRTATLLRSERRSH